MRRQNKSMIRFKFYQVIECPPEDNSTPYLQRKLAFTLATWNSNTNLAATHFLGLLDGNGSRSSSDRQVFGSYAFLQVAVLGALGGPSVLETSLELLTEVHASAIRFASLDSLTLQ